MNEQDKQLHNAIKAIPVPPDSDGFFERVDQLLSDQPTPNAHEPEDLNVHDFQHQELRVEKTGLRSKRRSASISLLATGIAAALIIGVVITKPSFITQPTNQGKDTQTNQGADTKSTSSMKLDLASQTRQNLINKIDSIQTMRGTIKYQFDDSVCDSSAGGCAKNGAGMIAQTATSMSNFTIDKNGSYLEKVTTKDASGAISDESVFSFDAPTSTLKQCNRNQQIKSWTCDELANNLDDFSSIGMMLATTSLLKANASLSNLQIEDTFLNSSPVFKLSFGVNAASTLLGNRAIIFIDKATDFPLKVQAFDGSRMIQDFELTNEQIDVPVNRKDLELPDLPGAIWQETNALKLKRMSLSDIEKRLGHIVVLPKNLDQDYQVTYSGYTPEPSELSYSECAYGPGRSYSQGYVVRYRRGLNNVDVVVFDNVAGAKACTSIEQYVSSRSSQMERAQKTHTRLTEGLFAGVDAGFVNLYGNGTLYAHGKRNTLLITGRIENDAALQIANSLETR